MAGKLRYFLYLRKRALIEWVQGLHRKRLYHNRAVTEKKKLLVVKLDSIGDYLLFRNYLKAIKESREFGNYEITLCGNQWWREISEKHDAPWIDKFVWVDYNRLADYDYNMSISIKLYGEAFDFAITPTFSRCRFTDELMLQSGAKIKIAHKGDGVNISAAQKKKNDSRYSRLITITGNMDFEFERNRQFFRALAPSCELPHSPHLNVEPRKEFDVVIAPGAKASFRQWAPVRFYEVALYLAKINSDLSFCICGSAAEKTLAEQIREAGNEIRFTDLTGVIGLNRLAGIMAGARVVLCNDSGPYHLAAAVDTPLICISNGNHYRRFCPYPPQYNKRNLEVFPPSLHRPDIDERTMLILQSEGSTLEINEITVEQVISSIAKNHFLHDTGLRSHH